VIAMRRAAMALRHTSSRIRLAGIPAALLAACLLVSAAWAQTTPPSAGAAQAAGPGKPAGPAARYLPSRFSGRAGAYYRVYWGIDQLVVKEAESGQILRFSWRVLDPERAAILNDKKLEPSLISPQAGVSLVVPVLDKIGQMRQTMPPEAGKSYWMAFSNKGHHIKRGDRVDVVVGTFRAEGLMVD
jgi:hypothetical protein